MTEEKKPTTKKKTAPDVVAPVESPSPSEPLENFGETVATAGTNEDSAQSVPSVEDVATVADTSPESSNGLPSIEELEASLAPKSEPVSVDVKEDSKIEYIDAGEFGDTDIAWSEPTLAQTLPDLRKRIWEECVRINKGNLSMGSLLVQKFKAVDVSLLNLEKFLKEHGYE
jgi:hypothetical protein